MIAVWPPVPAGYTTAHTAARATGISHSTIRLHVPGVDIERNGFSRRVHKLTDVLRFALAWRRRIAEFRQGRQ